jgi:hypothetical protein
VAEETLESGPPSHIDSFSNNMDYIKLGSTGLDAGNVAGFA